MVILPSLASSITKVNRIVKLFTGYGNSLDVLLKVMEWALLFKIMFGGVIIALANKLITTPSFTLLSVVVIISIIESYF